MLTPVAILGFELENYWGDFWVNRYAFQWKVSFQEADKFLNGPDGPRGLNSFPKFWNKGLLPLK